MTIHALSHARFRAPRACKIRRTLLRLMLYRAAKAAAVTPVKYCSAMCSRSPASNRPLQNREGAHQDWVIGLDANYIGKFRGMPHRAVLVSSLGCGVPYYVGEVKGGDLLWVAVLTHVGPRKRSGTARSGPDAQRDAGLDPGGRDHVDAAFVQCRATDAKGGDLRSIEQYDQRTVARGEGRVRMHQIPDVVTARAVGRGIQIDRRIGLRDTVVSGVGNDIGGHGWWR